MKLLGLLRGLSPREKMLIAGALGLLVVFLAYQLFYMPLLRSRETYRSMAQELEGRLDAITFLAEAHLADRAGYQELTAPLKRKGGESVLTFLENEARRAGIRDSIEYVRPQGTERKGEVIESSVEMKIDAVTLAELIHFLAGAQQGRKGLVVRYLRLKPFFRDREKVDAVVRLTDVMVE